MHAWQPLPESLPPEVRRLTVRLRDIKDAAGLNLDVLARRTPASRSAWGRYLNGQALPPREVVAALAALANADHHALLALWDLADHAHRHRQPPPPSNDTPRKNATSNDANSQHASREATPRHNGSNPHAPGTHASDAHAPGTHASDTHVPGAHASDAHVPGGQAPGAHTPSGDAQGPHAQGPHASGPHASGPHASGPHASGAHGSGARAPRAHGLGAQAMGSDASGSHASGPYASGGGASGPHAPGAHGDGGQSAGARASGWDAFGGGLGGAAGGSRGGTDAEEAPRAAWRRVRRVLVVGAGAVVIGVGVGLWLGTSPSKPDTSSPPTAASTTGSAGGSAAPTSPLPVSTAGVNCRDAACEQQSPTARGCVRDAVTAATVHVDHALVHLRYSPSCRAAWGDLEQGRLYDRIEVAVGGHSAKAKVRSSGGATSTPMLAAPDAASATVCASLVTGARQCGSAHL
ncbi:helix-turn-helix domain-containing protein [Actinomadura rupiterrae]|uniref:helix-turn-helix domain-containing protein n=1 Tax=Actinomadura rupiterrae TaxID=559627 RepID=UPI0020A2DA88|nr:XRE family transcriptional regulator [Actinomadura rupiterrae]MCP2337165.1 transcriptional regulator with XRE-family HTH domain [Actinomadura rupiterrae]